MMNKKMVKFLGRILFKNKLKEAIKETIKNHKTVIINDFGFGDYEMFIAFNGCPLCKYNRKIRDSANPLVIWYRKRFYYQFFGIEPNHKENDCGYCPWFLFMGACCVTNKNLYNDDILAIKRLNGWLERLEKLW